MHTGRPLRIAERVQARLNLHEYDVQGGETVSEMTASTWTCRTSLRGYESVYRNALADVSRYLNTRHGSSYLVLNLSERTYEHASLGHRVVELGFPDHHSPPVSVAWSLVRTMDAWLGAASENVCVVHCLAGKGRTGVIIACFLLFSGYILQHHLDEAMRMAAAAAATGAHSGPTPAPSLSLYSSLIASTRHAPARTTEAHGRRRAPMEEEDEDEPVDAAHAAATRVAPQPGLARDTRSVSEASVRVLAGPLGVAAATATAGPVVSPPRAPELSASARDALKSLASVRQHAHSGGEGVVVLPEPRRAAGDAHAPAHAAARTVSAPLQSSHAAAAAARMTAVATGSVTTATSASAAKDTTQRVDMPATLCLPTAADMCSQALALFRARRGEGVKYPSQERTVRYFARIVHDTLIAANEQLAQEESDAAARSAGISAASLSSAAAPETEVERGTLKLDPDAVRLSDSLARIMSAGETTKPVYIRTRAVKLLRSLKTLPLPRNVPICVTKFLINGVPALPGGFVPVLQITSQPYQGAETRVIYSSAWHTPVPAPIYYPKDEVIVFQMRALLQGDILVSCRHAPTNQEVFRFSFHTTFMSYEGVPGVYRLFRRDVDMERRKYTEQLFPPEFFLDMMYTVIEDGEGGFADNRLPSRRGSADATPDATKGTAAMTPSSSSGALVSPSPDVLEFADVRAAPPAPVGAPGVRARGVSSVSSIGVPAAAGESLDPTRTADGLSTVEVGRDTDVVCSGWLTKRGALVKTWKRRWFVLRSLSAPGAAGEVAHGRLTDSLVAADADEDGDGEDGGVVDTTGASGLLLYYRKPGDAAAKGVIPMTRDTLARISEVTPTDANAGKLGGRAFCFVVAREGRNHYLQAENTDDLHRWLAAIDRLRGSIRSPSGRSTPAIEVSDSGAASATSPMTDGVSPAPSPTTVPGQSAARKNAGRRSMGMVV